MPGGNDWRRVHGRERIATTQRRKTHIWDLQHGSRSPRPCVTFHNSSSSWRDAQAAHWITHGTVCRRSVRCGATFYHIIGCLSTTSHLRPPAERFWSPSSRRRFFKTAWGSLCERDEPILPGVPKWGQWLTDSTLVFLSICVCLFVVRVCEAIEMPFGGWLKRTH